MERSFFLNSSGFNLLNLTSKTNTIFQSVIVQNSKSLVTANSVDILGENISVLKNYDIIHLHNIYNFLNFKTIEKIENLNVKLVVTLHDERFLTGGCHGSFACENNLMGCKKCPQVRKLFRPMVTKSFREQNYVFNSQKSITLVAPSLWMKNKASTSLLTKNLSIFQIYNPVPDYYFKNGKDKEIKKSNEIRIGFVSSNLNNPYKGLKILIEALKSLPDKILRQFTLVLVGNGRIVDVPKNLKIIRIEYSSEQRLIYELKFLDFLILPSIQDNLPNIMLEVLSLGIPVIGSDAGGIPEVLKIFKNPIFKNGDSDSLANKLAELDTNHERKIIREQAFELFNERKIALNLNSVYSKLLNS